ncbi:MAG: hypothetical protein M3547_01115 [Acidobacteriota bacterium]|nr:hypothetical protein [Acidobacteriota bacterium]
MRKAAALLFAICGLLLLLTWHRDGGSVMWLWEKPDGGYYGFTPGWMRPADIALKVAGLAFVGVALLAYPRREL